MAEKFCLKWNDFHQNITKTFSNLRSEEDFFDVTLVSDDNRQLSAHKVVLSSCSEYFKNILNQNKHSHPLLCLANTSFEEMSQIMDYIYFGEVNLYQDDVDRFVQVAQRFKIKGLVVGTPKKYDDASDHNILQEKVEPVTMTEANMNGTIRSNTNAVEFLNPTLVNNSSDNMG